MSKAMNHKMEKQEYKDEYAKRSSVEGPFGIFKEQFQIEKEVVLGNINNNYQEIEKYIKENIKTDANY